MGVNEEHNTKEKLLKPLHLARSVASLDQLVKEDKAMKGIRNKIHRFVEI